MSDGGKEGVVASFSCLLRGWTGDSVDTRGEEAGKRGG